jgi:hypothetical protein
VTERQEDQRLVEDMRERYLALANAPRPSLGEAFYRAQLRAHDRATHLGVAVSGFAEAVYDCEKI